MSNDNRQPQVHSKDCGVVRDSIRAEIATLRIGDFRMYPRPHAEAAFRPLSNDECDTAVRFEFDGPDRKPVRVLLMYLLEDDEVLVLRSDAEGAA